MSSMVPPAASTAAFTFSQTWRVCSVMSPMPAMLPSGRRAVMPETNTKRPVASMAVAWENTPFGWRSFGEEIWTLGMALVPVRGEREGHVQLGGVAFQHVGDGGIDADLAGGALAAHKLRLAGRVEPLDAGGAASGPHALGCCCRLHAERPDVAEMRDVDGDEQMRAVVRDAEVAVERLHLRAAGALREKPAHQVDHE